MSSRERKIGFNTEQYTKDKKSEDVSVEREDKVKEMPPEEFLAHIADATPKAPEQKPKHKTVGFIHSEGKTNEQAHGLEVKDEDGADSGDNAKSAEPSVGKIDTISEESSPKKTVTEKGEPGNPDFEKAVFRELKERYPDFAEKFSEVSDDGFLVPRKKIEYASGNKPMRYRPSDELKENSEKNEILSNALERYNMRGSFGNDAKKPTKDTVPEPKMEEVNETLFEDSDNLDDIFSKLDELGSIEGKSATYSAEFLQNKIRDIMKKMFDYRENPELRTNSNYMNVSGELSPEEMLFDGLTWEKGLRKAVARILNKEWVNDKRPEEPADPEPSKVEKENPAPDFSSAESWDELYNMLREAGTIPSESGEGHDANEQMGHVTDIRDLISRSGRVLEKVFLEKHLNVISRTGGLRDKVKELTKKEFSLYDSRFEIQEAEKEKGEEDYFEDVKNLQDIVDKLDELGSIEGKSATYSAEFLQNKIRDIIKRMFDYREHPELRTDASGELSPEEMLFDGLTWEKGLRKAVAKALNYEWANSEKLKDTIPNDELPDKPIGSEVKTPEAPKPEELKKEDDGKSSPWFSGVRYALSRVHNKKLIARHGGKLEISKVRLEAKERELAEFSRQQTQWDEALEKMGAGDSSKRSKERERAKQERWEYYDRAVRAQKEIDNLLKSVFEQEEKLKTYRERRDEAYAPLLDKYREKLVPLEKKVADLRAIHNIFSEEVRTQEKNKKEYSDRVVELRKQIKTSSTGLGIVKFEKTIIPDALGAVEKELKKIEKSLVNAKSSVEEIQKSLSTADRKVQPVQQAISEIEKIMKE